ncbi:efflux RND transporter periplasmic adaptor subunit [Oscillatoria laete-virens NRMC-F 0139]|nr:efflux RND transporter periplasmic adaptor subunit [Oscillatoria laete-virens]MDL5053291.1 efflux RND transporter periplasmic adaptor subunit [Oscillatoria laete-virens NRMC-F 0139]
MTVTLLAFAGCGKPPSSGGPPPGDFPVQAIVAPVKREVLNEKITLVADMKSNEEILIRSEIDGRITDIGFEEGAPVEGGQILFRIDDSKLRAQLADAEASLKFAQTDAERIGRLLKERAVSQQETDRARTSVQNAQAAVDLAREQLRDAVIKAPFPGVMTERLVSVGQFVPRGQELAGLVQTDPLEANFNVPEKYIGQLALGQKIRLTSVAYPGEEFEGTVSFISPRLDPASRTILVKAIVDNSDGHLRPGMFGNLQLIFRAREGVLTIPESAISYRRDQASVFVRNEEGKAEVREVTVGLRVEGAAEILSGLSEGEQVVVEGFQKMGPGTTVLISPESARYGIEPAAEEKKQAALPADNEAKQ